MGKKRKDSSRSNELPYACTSERSCNCKPGIVNDVDEDRQERYHLYVCLSESGEKTMISCEDPHQVSISIDLRLSSTFFKYDSKEAKGQIFPSIVFNAKELEPNRSLQVCGIVFPLLTKLYTPVRASTT